MILRELTTFKALRSASAGELILLDLRNAPAFAIVMRQIESRTICAFLKTQDEERRPFHLTLNDGDEVCMSYGSDWFLDLQFGPETFPGNTAYVTTHGAIHIRPKGPVINLDRSPENIRTTAACFDLTTFSTIDLRGTELAPVLNWSIWQREDDRAKLGTQPLVKFSSPQT
jgi:hypothetical protein